MNEVHKLRQLEPEAAPWPALPAGTELASSVASRICHDLSSPLGAVGNGLELLQLSGLPPSPELALLEESVASVKARLRFFRLAYGAAGPQPVGRAEILDILATLSRGARLGYEWTCEGDVPRCEAKAVFLLLQCLETALPLGGRIGISRSGEGWEVTAQSLRLRVDPTLWASLGRVDGHLPEAANLVQFALLPQAVSDLARVLSVETAPDRITVRF